MVLLTIFFSLRSPSILLLGLVVAMGGLSHAKEQETSVKPENPHLPPTEANLFSLLEKQAAPAREGSMVCDFTYEASGSRWNPEVREEKVFLATLRAGDLRLGIGKGGQIYSLRGPFGESIPPQRAAAPWVDEVWHVVATNEQLIAPIHEFQNTGGPEKSGAAMPIHFFIHQAGTYLQGLTGTKETGAPQEPFYSPLLRSRWDPQSRTLYLANWAQQARGPNAWKSGLIVQTAYRDLGDGAIEVSQILSNFGDQILTYVNAPWGGVRRSALPQTILSQPDGGWKKVEGRWGWSDIPNAPYDETGGWIGWTVDPNEESSPSLALVFGREQDSLPAWQRDRSKIVYGTAGEEDRDYEAVEASCSVDLKPGESLLVRWYLISGPLEKIPARAAELAPFAGMERPEFDPEAAQPVWMRDGVPSTSGMGAPSFHLYAQPVPGTVPVFAAQESDTGKTFATLDLYKDIRRSPLTNPLPETHPEHSRYTDRMVYHTHESGDRHLELLGFAHTAPPSQGAGPEITLPAAKENELKVWGPAAPASQRSP